MATPPDTSPDKSDHAQGCCTTHEDSEPGQVGRKGAKINLMLSINFWTTSSLPAWHPKKEEGKASILGICQPDCSSASKRLLLISRSDQAAPLLGSRNNNHDSCCGSTT
ncbi:hypothetical protein Y1Q_0016174 [Alligator mississippiensis]|uniref:Uncharacterized protein n=1 Tax=Alligator mississippiensis TaxID=8496 RepID=A0A151P143_ALLMI|nr:hypothetical protein Y1Q_0016174 [Alligator mississippiensis]